MSSSKRQAKQLNWGKTIKGSWSLDGFSEKWLSKLDQQAIIVTNYFVNFDLDFKILFFLPCHRSREDLKLCLSNPLPCTLILMSLSHCSWSSLFLWGVTIWFCMENVLSQSIVCNGIIREIWASFIKFGISSLWCCVTVWWARDRAGGIIIVRFRFWLLVRLVSQSQS